MTLTIMLLVAGAVLVLGFVIGMRFSEVNMARRERELARQRRDLAEASRRTRQPHIPG